MFAPSPISGVSVPLALSKTVLGALPPRQHARSRQGPTIPATEIAAIGRIAYEMEALFGRLAELHRSGEPVDRVLFEFYLRRAVRAFAAENRALARVLRTGTPEGKELAVSRQEQRTNYRDLVELYRSSTTLSDSSERVSPSCQAEIVAHEFRRRCEFLDELLRHPLAHRICARTVDRIDHLFRGVDRGHHLDSLVLEVAKCFEPEDLPTRSELRWEHRDRRVLFSGAAFDPMSKLTMYLLARNLRGVPQLLNPREIPTGPEAEEKANRQATAYSAKQYQVGESIYGLNASYPWLSCLWSDLRACREVMRRAELPGDPTDTTTLMPPRQTEIAHRGRSGVPTRFARWVVPSTAVQGVVNAVPQTKASRPPQFVQTVGEVILKAGLNSERAMRGFESGGGDRLSDLSDRDFAAPFMAYRAARIVRSEQQLLLSLGRLHGVDLLDQMVSMRQKSLARYLDPTARYNGPITNSDSIPLMTTKVERLVLDSMRRQREELRVYLSESPGIRRILAEVRGLYDSLPRGEGSSRSVSDSPEVRLALFLRNYSEHVKPYSEAEVRNDSQAARGILFDQSFAFCANVVVQRLTTVLENVPDYWRRASEIDQDGKFAQRALDSLQEWLGESPVLLWAHAQLISLLHDDYLMIRDYVMHANVRIVKHTVAPYRREGLIDEGSLLSAGNLGLLEAIDRHDPDKGGKLSTMAPNWIRRHAREVTWTNGTLIEIPTHSRRVRTAMAKVTRIAQKDWAPPPSIEDLAALSGCTTECVRSVVGTANVAALDRPIGGGSNGQENRALGETVASRELAVDPVENEFVRTLVSRGLEFLRPRERTVIEMHYGLRPFTRIHTLEEIGQSLRLTRERIRQIEARAILRLSEKLARFNAA
jgi:RNA polymerase sigma factor (sigma-70 family)